VEEPMINPKFRAVTFAAGAGGLILAAWAMPRVRVEAADQVSSISAADKQQGAQAHPPAAERVWRCIGRPAGDLCRGHRQDHRAAIRPW